MAVRSDKAIRVAVQALLSERQKLAFDANLYQMGIAEYPYARTAFERRTEIDAAISDLTKDLDLPAAQQPAAANRPNLEQMEMFS